MATPAHELSLIATPSQLEEGATAPSQQAHNAETSHPNINETQTKHNVADRDYYQRLADWAIDRQLQNYNPPFAAPRDRYYATSRLLDFAPLMGISLQHTQKQLCDKLENICRAKTTNEDDLEQIRKLLKHYLCAIRDYREMERFPTLHSSKFNKLLHTHQFLHPEHEASEAAKIKGLYHRSISIHTDRDVDADETGTTRERNKRALLRRSKMALSAWVALVVPLIIMSIEPSLKKSLATAVVAMVFFGIICVFATNASEQEVLLATAGYAAVQVVFVGASLPAIK